MPFAPLRYEPLPAAAAVPNVVVDGSPNASTVLTISHWPGLTSPAQYRADLSAQMAFRYLEAHGAEHGDAAVVTNNHFDQDGLVSVYVFTEPGAAVADRELLEDLAAAGDFATYRDRTAARLSMVISAYADPECSPLAPLPDDYDTACGVLYRSALESLPAWLDDPGRVQDLWIDEDRRLADSEAAVETGAVTIEEYDEVDLAVVRIGESVRPTGGHRFAARRFHGIHPMAIHNATDRLAVLLLRGRQYELTYRYESWVQYQSRPVRPRVDLGPLARRLGDAETGGVAWEADPPGELTPGLRTAGRADSSLDASEVLDRIVQHLSTAPAAWNPYPAPAASA